MKKIIILIGVLSLFLFANLFCVYHSEATFKERKFEVWGIKYNPTWYEAFR